VGPFQSSKTQAAKAAFFLSRAPDSFFAAAGSGGDIRAREAIVGGGKRRAGIAGQCAKLLFAHKERFNACWTN
jgi:hypothetical protein